MYSISGAKTIKKVAPGPKLEAWQCLNLNLQPSNHPEPLVMSIQCQSLPLITKCSEVNGGPITLDLAWTANKKVLSCGKFINIAAAILALAMLFCFNFACELLLTGPLLVPKYIIS